MEIKMNVFWKKLGWLSLAASGLFASLILQVTMGLAGGVVSGFIAGIQGSMQGLDEAALAEMISAAVMDGAVWGVLGYHVVSLPVFGLWYYFGCGRRKPVNPFKAIKGRGFLVILVMSLGFCLFANGMVLLEEFLTPSYYEQYLDLMEQAGFGVNPLTIIASVLLAPIGEELLCRGIIFHYAMRAAEGVPNRKLAFWIANGLQAFLFGVMHGNLIQGSYAFLLGMGLGYLRFRFDSLYASMLAHFLINFLSTFVMGMLLFAVPETVLGAVILLGLGAAVIAAAGYIGRGEGVQIQEF